MFWPVRSSLLTLAAVLACAPSEDHALPHWDYADLGPGQWGALDPQFATCATGAAQSPIDVRDVVAAPVGALRADFGLAELRIVHNEHVADILNTGHSVQVNYPDGDTLVVGNDRYALLQYHFHSPSEHFLEGRPFPAEVHFVHRAPDGRLAVVGVLIEEGAENPAYAPVWENLPSTKGVEVHLEDVMVDVDALLPVDHASYRYAGSLTTPPCSEGVTWIVMRTPVTLSSTQLAQLRAVLTGNNRPIQPMNGRRVMRDDIAETDLPALGTAPR